MNADIILIGGLVIIVTAIAYVLKTMDDMDHKRRNKKKQKKLNRSTH